MARTLLALVLSILCLSLSNCETDKNTNGLCMSRISDSPDRKLLSAEELSVIEALFDSNNIDYSEYQFFRLSCDGMGNRHIRCYQFKNGLEVFTNQLIFHFNSSGQWNYLSGDTLNAFDITPEPLTNEEIIFKKYIDLIRKDTEIQWDNNDFTNQCFTLETGYYDLNAGISGATQNFVLAWNVKPTRKGFPQAYFNDQSQDLIYYSNGITH